MGGKQAELPGSEGCDQQYEVQSVTSGIPQHSVAEPMLVYLCVTDLDKNESSGSWLMTPSWRSSPDGWRAGLLFGGTSAGRLAGTPGSSAKAECRTWHGVTPCCGTSWVLPACLQSCFAGKDSTDKLNTSEQWALAMKRADFGKGAARGPREVVLPLCEAVCEITSGHCA